MGHWRPYDAALTFMAGMFSAAGVVVQPANRKTGITKIVHFMAFT